MNKIISLIAIAAVLSLVIGCAGKTGDTTVPTSATGNTETPTTTEPTTTPAKTISMGSIYDYASAKQFEYQINSNVGGESNTMTLKYTMSADTANGKSAWLQQTDMNVQGNTVTNKLWMDKTTLACIKTTTEINVNGQTIQNGGVCPTEGPNKAGSSEAPSLSYVSTESVTVPAGTFTAKKYQSDGITFWAADNVPIPVKVSYGQPSSVDMELVSYK